MAKRKYAYAIVEKENGNLFIMAGHLSIYYRKEVAQKVLSDYGNDNKKYIVHPISLEGLEKLILYGNKK